MVFDAVHGIDKLKAQLVAEDAAVAEARAQLERREAQAEKTKKHLGPGWRKRA